MDTKEYENLKCDFCGSKPARPVVISTEKENLFVCERWWCRFKLMLVQWAHWRVRQ